MSDSSLLYFWCSLTRLGEAQLLLPAALVAAWVMLRRPDARPLALRWLAVLATAALLTTASKIAFLGWGLGWAELNFTGISGHSMFAAAIYPLLIGTLAARSPRGKRLGIAVGALLALLVGVSRVVVGAHSSSEVLAGWLVGGVAGSVALGLVRVPRVQIAPALSASIVAWLALTPTYAPASQTHPAVVRLSLLLSGRAMSFTRDEMLRGLHERQERQDPGEARRVSRVP